MTEEIMTGETTTGEIDEMTGEAVVIEEAEEAAVIEEEEEDDKNGSAFTMRRKEPLVTRTVLFTKVEDDVTSVSGAI